MSNRVRFLALAFFAVAILVIALGVSRNCFRASYETYLVKEIGGAPPTFQVSAQDLVNEYLEDETAATAKYNGKVGVVTGKARRQFGMQNAPELDVIHLYASGTWIVRCFLAPEEELNINEHLGRLRSLRISETVTYGLIGKVEGFNGRRLALDIRDCALHDPPYISLVR